MVCLTSLKDVRKVDESCTSIRFLCLIFLVLCPIFVDKCTVKAKKPIPIHPQKLPAGLPYEFQSMPPYGGDRIALKSERWSGYFNPRPHTGGGDVRRASLSFSSSSIFFRERRFPDFPIPVSRCLFFLFASLSHLQDYGSFQIIGLFDSRENNNDVLPFSLYGEVLCCRKAIDNGRG